MQPIAETISIEIHKDTALNLADALDYAAECLDEEHGHFHAPPPMDPQSPQAPEFGTELEDARLEIEDQICAVKSVLLKLNRELPKHFPELSRAARRAKDNAEED